MNIDTRSSYPPASSLKPTAHILCGPTGVGKSALAIELALRLDGEVIGADAFQLYRGLPLLTAQPQQKRHLSKRAYANEAQDVSSAQTLNVQEALEDSITGITKQFATEIAFRKKSNKTPYHLVGVIPVTEECDAMCYRAMALPLIEEIVSCRRIPLITGGTGFYIRSLFSPLDPLPAADLALRARLATCAHEELLIQLQQLDSMALQQIDTKNRRRVERALEIIIQTGKPLSEVWKKNNTSSDASSHSGLLLIRDREDLHDRIEKNVQAMFNLGVVDEVAALDGIQLSRTASLTLGLREIQAYRRGEISLPATIAAITQSTKRYAKRQMTWFRNQHSFPTLNLSPFSSMEEAVEAALQLLASQK